METQGTANNQAKDWRKKGLGWIPDYPDQRDYLSESEEDKKSGNLRRNEVTKSIEDIAENLLEVIEALQDGFPANKKLKELKTGLQSKIFGQAAFKKVKVYNRNLRLGIEPSPQINSQVINLKYYFEALSFHPKLSAYFQPRTILNYDTAKYWEWLNNEEFKDDTEKIVKEFQKQVKIREDGIVGRETYTAISKYLGESDCSPPEKLTPLAYLLPTPIWIQGDTFKIIFDNLKSWWSKYNEGENVEIALAELLDPEAPQSSNKFFEMFKQEFYVVEPIVSVINGMMSPFAIWDNLDSSLQNALSKFDNFDKEQDNSYKTGAIFMVKKRLETQLTELEDKQEQNEQDKLQDKLTITFYIFIKKIVQGYISTYELKVDEQKLLNSFSTRYLFEIDTSQEENNTSSQKRGVEITSATPLEVLINRNWDEKYVLRKNLTYYAILPSIVDLSSWCSPIRDQGSINSCTAFATAALLEYFARKAKDERTYVSPLFLYKVARNLMNSTGDVGASVRETMKAMVAFGVPPEKYWSYEADKFDEDPPAFCYSYAQSYKTLKYFRLDRPELTKEILLFQIQATLAAEFPCIFGFTVYSSIYEEKVCSGCIPYPGKGDQVIGGHTVLAVGYDEYKKIKSSDGKHTSKGALLIRNSWGTGWGQKGYGWLPYDYVLKGLTADWWSLIKAEWFETGNFGLGAHAPKHPGGQVGRD